MSVFENFAEDDPGVLHVRLDPDLHARLRKVEDEARGRGLRLSVQQVLLGHVRDLVAAAESELRSAQPARDAGTSKDAGAGGNLPTGLDALTD